VGLRLPSVNDPRWLTPAELKLWQSFMLAQHDLERVISADLASSNLSHADYAVLVALSGGDSHGIRVGRLRDWIGWESSRLAHQLRRMEQRGLVDRRRASEDGRGTVVTITDEGRARIVAAAPGHVETVRRFFMDLMTNEQREVLQEVFHRVNDAVVPDRPPLADLS